MLWRVRVSLPDRPGALAELARHCGEADVNILGLQIFLDVARVTDELVLRTPGDWTEEQVLALLTAAGAEQPTARTCSETALVDQPTRFVQAARTVLAQPARFPEVVATLFDAEPEPVAGPDAVRGHGPGDLMELAVGEVVVVVRRSAPFTATEHARGAALAELVSDVLTREAAALVRRLPGMRLDASTEPEVVVSTDAVTAMSHGTAVGVAVLREEAEPGSRRITLEVDPAWQRRGIGRKLLREAARLAHRQGAEELLFVTEADNRAVLPVVFASGMRGRIRTDGTQLVVRVPLRDPVR